MHRLSFLFFATSFASFCGETFRAAKGLLTSKEVFGESYRNKIDCRWHIQPNSIGTTIPKRLHLRVDFLNLGEERLYSENSKLACLWDSLSLFEVAENGNVSNITTLCKNNSTSFIFEADKNGLVKIGLFFFTDASESGAGFQLAWKTVFKEERCWPHESSLTYNGTLAQTVSGRSCQNWNVSWPHVPKAIPTTAHNHNFCRNPDSDLRGAWCYTTDPQRRWESCDVSVCDDGVKLVYDGFDESSGETTFYEVSANPEVHLKRELSSIPILATINGRVTAFAMDDKRKFLIYAIKSSSVLYFYSLSTERESFSLKETFFLISDKSEITDLAVSGDFVWFILKTEQLVSVIGSVNLDSSEPSFSLAQPIVGLPWQALAVSNSNVIAAFRGSFYQNSISETKMSMERALFKNASFAFETSAMSFDEIENKLYWVKNGETVFSSNANGEEVTRHVTIEGAQISCLVSKGDFIFAADELLDEESREYKIHVISKKNEQTAVNYRVDKKLTCVGLFTRF